MSSDLGFHDPGSIPVVRPGNSAPRFAFGEPLIASNTLNNAATTVPACASLPTLAPGPTTTQTTSKRVSKTPMTSRLGRTAKQQRPLAHRLGTRTTDEAAAGPDLADRLGPTPPSSTCHPSKVLQTADRRRERRDTPFPRRRIFRDARPAATANANAPTVIDLKQGELSVSQLEARAERFSVMPDLRRRALRFEAETAGELVQVSHAKKKNARYRRFAEENDDEGLGADDEEEGLRPDGELAMLMSGALNIRAE